MFRRDFLKYLSFIVAACAVTPGTNIINLKNNVVLLPYENFKTGKSGIFSFNFDTNSFFHTATNFNVHSIFYDEQLDEFIGVNKYGPAYLKFKGVSFGELKYYQTDAALYNFSGHVASAQYDPDYYLTAISAKNGKSIILNLNKKTHQFYVAAEIEKSDPPAHDCKFDQSQNNLIFTASNRIYQMNRYSKKIESDGLRLSNSDSSLRHFSISPNNDICLQSNIISTKDSFTYSGAEVVLRKNEKTSSFLTEKIKHEIKDNELLDFSFDSTGKIFACVHGGSRFLTIWGTEPFKNLRSLEFRERIIRVSNFFNKPYFLVIGSEHLYLIDTQSFSIQKLNTFSSQLSNEFLYSHKTLVTV